ncbi:MAG: hypothetical protein BWX88_04547 [Planctomycetes bacterium ADurb.Bin126]|nr:MAG: hypothetical protein BWX88_04547 [Planctomycetes bacterium ADurb.Bin126]
MNTRYDGRPLLRFLECYVLWAIGQLDDSLRATLQALTPKLQRTYGTQGEWHEIIASVMDLPSNMPELIREVWERNQTIARERNLPLVPQRFAEMFVDDNLVK